MITVNPASLALKLLSFAAMPLMACVDIPASAQAPAQSPSGKTYTLKDLVIEAPWSRETPVGARVAGGFFRITNKGTISDRLVGGSFSRAGRLEVHEMAVVGGVMRMRELGQGLEIKPGQTVELKPGSFHVMFMDLKEGLKAGETVKGSLVFANAGSIEVNYTVAPRTVAPAKTNEHKH